MLTKLIHDTLNNMHTANSIQDLIDNNTIIIKLPNINKEELKQSFKQLNALFYDKNGITTNELLYGSSKADVLIMDFNYFNNLTYLYSKLMNRFGPNIKIVVIG